MNDIVLKAVAVALEAHPALNSALIAGAIHRYRTINLGVAVDVDADVSRQSRPLF